MDSGDPGCDDNEEPEEVLFRNPTRKRSSFSKSSPSHVKSSSSSQTVGPRNPQLSPHNSMEEANSFFRQKLKSLDDNIAAEISQSGGDGEGKFCTPAMDYPENHIDSSLGEVGLTTIQELSTLNNEGNSVIQDADGPYEAFCSSTNEVTGRSVSEFVRFMSEGSCSTIELSSEVLSDEQTISSIIHEMAENPFREALQIKGLRSLRNLLSDEDRRTMVGRHGGIQATVNAMRSFPDQTVVQKHGLCFLADICQSNKCNKLQAYQCGAVKVITSFLRESATKATNLRELGFLALWACCHELQMNQALAGTSGAVEVTLETIRNVATGVSLQEKCLRVLLVLVKECNVNITLLNELGGVQEILATVRKYPDDVPVQIAALQLSCVLLRKSEAIRVSMEQGGLIEDIEKSLLEHANNRPFVTACCGCIRFLSFIRTVRESIGDTCIISRLLEVVRDFQKDEQVLVDALLALGNITFDNPKNKHKAASDDGLSVLLELLKMHKGRRLVTEQTCRVLRNIADGKRRTKRLCVLNNVIEAVTQAMKEQPAAPGVQEHGAATVLNLFGTDGVYLDEVDLLTHVELGLSLHTAAPAAQRQLNHLRNALQKLVPRSNSFLAVLFGRPFGNSNDFSVRNAGKRASYGRFSRASTERRSSQGGVQVSPEEVLGESDVAKSTEDPMQTIEY